MLLKPAQAVLQQHSGVLLSVASCIQLRCRPRLAQDQFGLLPNLNQAMLSSPDAQEPCKRACMHACTHAPAAGLHARRGESQDTTHRRVVVLVVIGELGLVAGWLRDWLITGWGHWGQLGTSDIRLQAAVQP